MKKGLKPIAAGLAIFLIGAVVVPIVFILPAVSGDGVEHQFVVPGVTELEIAEPGRYHLWNDFQTVFGGNEYDRSEIISDGVEISIQHENGESLILHSDTSIASSSESRSKNSIGYMEVEQPGTVTVTVAGVSEQRVFSISQFGVGKFFGLIFGGLGLSLVLAFVGIGISAWGIITLVRASVAK